MPHPSITAAARQIAAAVAEHEKSSAALDCALAARARIADRIAALDASRAEIIVRRQRGEVLPDDGGALALNAADREGLAAMTADADTMVSAARGPGPGGGAGHRSLPTGASAGRG